MATPARNPGSNPASFRMSGAVDLGGLRQPAPPSDGNASDHVIDVTEATFQADVIDKSREVPVVIDFWASWCGPCRQLSPILEKLAAADGGKWVLAKIDTDANQRISAAAGVQGIPAVKAVVDGQIVGEFTGALPESQVRQWIDQVLTIAEQPGGAPAPGEEPAPSPSDTALDAAYDALANSDLDGAETILRQALERDPGDAAAKAALVQLNLVRRAAGHDEAELRGTVERQPDDVAANAALADIELLNGQLDEAFSRLLGLFRRLPSDQRDVVRTHLLELFEAVDPGEPAVIQARRDLANALF
jgi:putative thioredoxin